jgi:hypothetical protein
MRFWLSVLIWIFFVGGLWAYTLHRDASLPQGPSQVAAPERLAGNYVLEITPTFSVEKDPFALDLDDGADTSGLELRLNGEALDLAPEDLGRGQAVTIQDGMNLVPGFNEVYVTASPPMAESHLTHGLRVRLLENGTVLKDQTLWGGQGAVVAGTIALILNAKKEVGHDH